MSDVVLVHVSVARCRLLHKLTLLRIQSLVFTLGPLLLPRVIAFVRSIRASSQQKHAIRPASPRVTRALNVLFIAAAVSLLSTLPYFAPPSIFHQTQSRLQIPTDVLFTRLAGLRPLTPVDEALKAKFVSLESRLLYLTFGPDVVASCPFCKSEESRSYFYYALPSLLAPHLLHLAALGVVTSSLLCGSEGSRWRTHATVAGVGLAVADVWLVGSYEHKDNSRATRLADVEFFYWRMRIVRGVALALTDGLLGWGLWLTATNRWQLSAPDVPERLESSARLMELANSKLSAVGALRNVVFRNSSLRDWNMRYWVQEGKVMADINEDREVVDGVRNALGRLDINTITQQASRYADSLMGGYVGSSTTAAD